MQERGCRYLKKFWMHAPPPPLRPSTPPWPNIWIRPWWGKAAGGKTPTSRKRGAERPSKMKWNEWRFEIEALAVWGWPRYLSVTEVLHNIEYLRVSGEETFCFFETWRLFITFQAGSFNHCIRIPAQENTGHCSCFVFLLDQLSPTLI